MSVYFWNNKILFLSFLTMKKKCIDGVFLSRATDRKCFCLTLQPNFAFIARVQWDTPRCCKCDVFRFSLLCLLGTIALALSRKSCVTMFVANPRKTYWDIPITIHRSKFFFLYDWPFIFQFIRLKMLHRISKLIFCKHFRSSNSWCEVRIRKTGNR